jgi:hypothetical protein
MASRQKTSKVRRAGSAIARTAKKLTSKLRPHRRSKAQTEEPVTPRASTRATPKVKTGRAVARPAARTTKRQTDVPLDALAKSYTPKQTSLKSSFRANGADRQRDQDSIGERWNDEDHYTNKSKDPRIGTHGRAYEPGERKYK